jgi:hypothetical protein
VSEKVFGIPEENFTINIKLFLQAFKNVELLRQFWKVSKASPPGGRFEPTPSWFTFRHFTNAPHLPNIILCFTCKCKRDNIQQIT